MPALATRGLLKPLQTDCKLTLPRDPLVSETVSESSDAVRNNSDKLGTILFEPPMKPAILAALNQ
jgi:hypothetical protein